MGKATNVDRTKKKKFVTCPECGNALFRGTDSYIEIRCPRCKAKKDTGAGRLLSPDGW